MSKQYVIGIDMGGTNTVIGIVNARGEILYQTAIDTTAHKTGESYADALSEAVNTLVEKSGLKDQIKGIGIGAPNGNYKTGTIEKAANIEWAKGIVVPLAQMVSDRTDFPCKLTNDANAAAVGEMTYGVAKGMKDFIVITLGTGVGSGIVAGGELIVGHDGLAGELGHVISVRHNGRVCGCGRSGCLETYASANGVSRSAREFLSEKDTPSSLRNIIDRSITSKDVFEAAEEGDELAIEIFNYTGRILGEAFADFIAFSSPEAIVLFGGLAGSWKYLEEPIQKSLDENVLNVFKGKTKLLLSELKGAEAAILGASALAWE
ncbi:glucokinase [Bacteroidia bacterium]|nr:glucokinase [Bacteroidia bacterium]GHU89244.1 glucokinase [Bacteroidia bacterium]GHV22996.1 glucokinase [Bacteroidia bacterium]